MMNGYHDGTAYDSEKLLKQLDSMDEEKKSASKEIRIRFSERQCEKLKAFSRLELKEQLDIMYIIIDFVVKQVQNDVTT